MYMDDQNQLDFHVQININSKRKDVAAGDTMYAISVKLQLRQCSLCL
jgi:hypothetical protein